MVHEDQGRLLEPLGQPPLQPGETLGAHLAMAVARHHGVEPDQAHLVAFDGVVQETVVVLQVAVRAELGEELGAAVVVAGHEIDRHGERLEDVAQHLVFLGKPAVGEIAGGDHQVGLARQGLDGGHRRLEHGVGVDPLVGDLAARADMQVGDLGDHHGDGPFSERCSSSRPDAERSGGVSGETLSAACKRPSHLFALRAPDRRRRGIRATSTTSSRHKAASARRPSSARP